MKRYLKVSLIGLGSILIILLITGLAGWLYLRSTFLHFEGDFPEPAEFETITLDGYTFLDRNGNGALDIYEDDRRKISDRVEDLLQQMTIEEKIHLLKGSGLASAMGRTKPGEGIPGAVGTIVPTPRLGLPTVYLSDGPAGLRIEPNRKGEERTYYCTAFPIGTLLASTWNTELVEQVGRAMGNEALEYGIDVILGPGANIHRHPFCGRNFEYYSEDPILTGHIGAAMVNGIESNGVGTSVKHFVANNQETDRHINDVIVSERALREIYLKGFEIMVEKAQPWTIMSSYNKVNGTYASEHKELLTDVLRGEWGFEGLVMSDWFGGKDAPAMISAGNDLLEPGTKKQWNALKEAYQEGTLSAEDIDTAAGRILKLILSSRKMQNYDYQNNPDLEAHARLTRQSAAEGMVLLKNEGTLPLIGAKNVALLGVTSYDFIAGGTGSGDVNEAYIISLEEGLINNGFKINATAKDIFVEHREKYKDEFIKPEGIHAMLEPYDPPEIAYTEEQVQQIVTSSDLAVITIGRNSGEGGDRIEKDDFLLSEAEKEMIDQTCRVFHAAGKQVVVVLNIGGVIETASWQAQPDAILLAWQGGQEGGNAVADILVGRMNPSGKLPMTFPVLLEDHASHANFPLDGEPMSIWNFIFRSKEKPEEKKVRNKDYTLYEEGIYVGYRHFDKADLEVSYPFGYGLSYTSFAYDDMAVQLIDDTIHVTVTITNTGERSGKEVIQIYTSTPESLGDHPVRELRAFAKTKEMNPGERIEVKITIPIASLSYWNEDSEEWTLLRGIYTVQAGSSSRDIQMVRNLEW